jgi:glycopeptide antibiotics resistance protein
MACELVVLILAVYFLLVLLITLGNRSFDTEIEVNLRLFSTYEMMFDRTLMQLRDGNLAKAWQEFIWIGYVSWSCVILNILLFVPLGYLLPLSNNKLDKWYFILMIGTGLSAAIEVTQLLTHRGWFDVDDIFHNGIGSLLGWVCYRLWLKVHKA